MQRGMAGAPFDHHRVSVQRLPAATLPRIGICVYSHLSTSTAYTLQGLGFAFSRASPVGFYPAQLPVTAQYLVRQTEQRLHHATPPRNVANAAAFYRGTDRYRTTVTPAKNTLENQIIPCVIHLAGDTSAAFMIHV